jgi:hypothetical protein
MVSKYIILLGLIQSTAIAQQFHTGLIKQGGYVGASGCLVTSDPERGLSLRSERHIEGLFETA